MDTAKRKTLGIVLAVVGWVLVFLPLALPLVFAIGALVSGRGFLLDWLMPAELFPAVLLGEVLLLAAAFVARTRKKLLAAPLVILAIMVIVGLVGGPILDRAAGAAGDDLPAWIPLVGGAGMAVYAAGMVVALVGGALLLRDLRRRGVPPLEGSSEEGLAPPRAVSPS